MTGVLMRKGNLDTNTQGKHNGKIQRNADTGEDGHVKTETEECPELPEARSKEGSSPEASKVTRPCQHLDFRIGA